MKYYYYQLLFGWLFHNVLLHYVSNKDQIGLLQGLYPGGHPPPPGDNGLLEFAETLKESVLLYAWLTTS